MSDKIAAQKELIKFRTDEKIRAWELTHKLTQEDFDREEKLRLIDRQNEEILHKHHLETWERYERTLPLTIKMLELTITAQKLHAETPLNPPFDPKQVKAMGEGIASEIIKHKEKQQKEKEELIKANNR